MQNLLIRGALANCVSGIIAHVTGLLDQLMRDDFLEGCGPRSIALCRAHLVGSLLGVL